MATNIVPFEAWHLDQLQLQQHEIEMLDHKRFLANVFAPGNDCRSTFHDGKLLGSAGYIQPWPGVMEMFIIPSKYIFEYPHVAFRVCYRTMSILKAHPDIHRLQSSVLDDPTRVKFIEKLGFVYEGRMRLYTKNKQDYLMYALVKENI
jgi:RimJ/RimL family protein N-acetyltransferase